MLVVVEVVGIDVVVPVLVVVVVDGWLILLVVLPE